MTEHLPECPCQCDYDCGGPCICDALRACEERVLKDTVTRHLALIKMIGLGILQTRADELRACEERVREDEQSHNFSPDIHWDGMAEAYQRGLDVAREAVADINGKWVFGPRIYKHKALAAIDALRKSSDD